MSLWESNNNDGIGILRLLFHQVHQLQTTNKSRNEKEKQHNNQLNKKESNRSAETAKL